MKIFNMIKLILLLSLLTIGSGVDSGNMSKGDVLSFTFDKVGVYDYICGPHPYMRGSVIVE